MARGLPCERFTAALASRPSCITRGRGGWLNLPRGGLPLLFFASFLAHTAVGQKCEELTLSTTSPVCLRFCCKSLLSISTRNIDSKSGVNTQQRFKRANIPIRLFQVSISQSLLGDFCNTIPPKADSESSIADVAEGQKAACNCDVTNFGLISHSHVSCSTSS